MSRQARGKRPVYFNCPNCGVLKKSDVTEELYGDMSYLFCNDCGADVEKLDPPRSPQHCPEPREPRVIDLTQPMPCIVSVRVTEQMIDDDEIPF